MRCTLLLGVLVLCGCSMSGDVEALEAQLRRQEDRVRKLEERLASAEFAARTARRETQVLRSQLEDPSAVPRPEQLAAGLALHELRFHKLLSAVLDEGSERNLHVVLQPVDRDGDLVKVNGQVEIRVLDLAAAESDQELGAWQFDEAETRALWRSNAIGSGFVADLPLPHDLRSRRLLLHARLRTVDGRQFNTSHSVQL